MAVTATQIRNLLNRPRGLNEETIDEYITIRTDDVNSVARSSTLYGIAEGNEVTDTAKESAIKFLVCCDCLRIMIDTIPSYVPENEQRQQDIRLNAQLRTFEKRADELLARISEGAGTAFVVSKTSSRQETA
jgi:hypothetical protein